MKCYNCNATQATPPVSCPDVGLCGAPFDASGLTWKKEEAAAAYVNKIFSAHKAPGSSLFYALNTADATGTFLSS